MRRPGRCPSIVGLAALALLAGCVRRGGPDPFAVRPTRPWAVDASLLGQLETLRASQEGLRAVRGRARGMAIEGRKKRPFRQVYALQRPSAVRIEIESSVGQTLALFVCDGETIYFKQRGDEPPVIGPANRETVERTLGYDLDVEELLDTLLARVGAVGVSQGQIVQRAGDVVFLRQLEGGRRLEYGLDVRNGVLRSRTYYDRSGRREVMVLYLAYTAEEGRVLPSRLQIRDFDSGDTVELNVSKLTVDPDLRPEAFRNPLGER